MSSRKTGNRPGLMTRREESRFFRQERLAGLFAAVLFLLMGGWSAGEINGDHYETLRARPVGEVLEPDLITGPYDQVEDPVLHDGYTNVYRITSPFGSFVAHGDAMFARLRRELTAIADLHERTAVGMTAESAVKEVVEPVRAIGRLVKEPGHTLVGIPRGVARLIESTTVGLSHEPGPYEDQGFEAWMRVSAYKRRIAAHYHVDAYSTNPVLQDELERAAWAHLTGYATTFALILVPAPNPLPLMLTSLTTVAVLNRVLEENGPADLEAINRQRLEAMRVNDELTGQFLTHSAYSPRHQTVIVYALEQLSRATHRERFLEAAVTALSEEEALFYQQAAELLAAYHQRQAPLIDIDLVGHLPIGLTETRRLFCPLPLDYGVWTDRSEQAYQRLVRRAATAGEGFRLDLWLTGSLSQQARLELLQRGVAPRERLAREIPLIDLRE